MNLRQQLILAGMAELNRSGLQNFSVRKITSQCGVSCAAPYKHFKDKPSFIAAVIAHTNQQWLEKQREIALIPNLSIREKLVQISLAYIRFLVKNPYFRSALTLKDTKLGPKIRSQLSQPSYRLIIQYCEQVQMSPADRRRKTYIVRSLIYGAALMLDNGELENNSETMQMIAYSIDREFELK